MKGLGGVFGAHPLIALSVLFVLVEIEALHPGKHLVPCCDLLALPAQGELARLLVDHALQWEFRLLKSQRLFG